MIDMTVSSENFKRLYSVPTLMEQCSGFSIIKYFDISKNKSSRLIEIDKRHYNKPYIVEVVHSKRDLIEYKAYYFKNLSTAIHFQHGL